MQRETGRMGKEEAGAAAPAVAEDKIMTLVQAAEFLETSYSTVYRLVADGELRAFRLRIVQGNCVNCVGFSSGHNFR